MENTNFATSIYNVCLLRDFFIVLAHVLWEIYVYAGILNQQ